MLFAVAVMLVASVAVFALPVRGPVNPVAVNIPVPALYVRPASVFGARSPVAESHKPTNAVVSVVSATVIVAGTMFAEPLNDTPPIVLAFANSVAVSALPVTSPVKSPVIAPDAFTVVNVPAAAEFAPMIAPSIAPPLMSKFEPSISTAPASNFLASSIFSLPFVVTNRR